MEFVYKLVTEMKYNLFIDGGTTFVGCVLLRLIGDKYFKLPQNKYLNTVSNLEIKLKINNEGVDFIQTIKDIENTLDNMILEKASEIIDSKQSLLQEAYRIV